MRGEGETFLPFLVLNRYFKEPKFSQKILSMSLSPYLVTVITPVGPSWNSDFLADARDSLKTNETPFQWILSLDGANPKEVRKVVGDEAIVIGDEQNFGVAQARNKALKLVETEYVYAFDADDYSLQGIDKLLAVIPEHGDGVWAAGKAYDVDSDGKNIIYVPNSNLAPFSSIIPINGFVETADITGVYPFLCSGATLVSTKVVKQFGGWDEQLKDVSEDVMLFAKISATHVGAWQEDFVLAYRKHEASITAQPSDKTKQTFAHAKVRAEVTKILNKL